MVGEAVDGPRLGLAHLRWPAGWRCLPGGEPVAAFPACLEPRPRARWCSASPGATSSRRTAASSSSAGSTSAAASSPRSSPISDSSILDRAVELGFNAIRLPFIWEGFEPEPGRYDEAYLARMVAIAAAAWGRGLYVIVNIHQDGFARILTRGCGSGFPLWAVSPRSKPYPPDNGCDCKGWAIHGLTDPNMHRSFADFYADNYGVRTRYLAMLGRVAGAFAAIPGVVGYDPLNEPWGDERREIVPLYRDAARALRARHPSAILFLEVRGPTAAGFRTWMPNPCLDNVAFAPHYYKPIVIALEDWSGQTAAIDRAFERMEAKAAEWGVPLVLGEIGVPGDAGRAAEYMDYLYDHARRGPGLGLAVVHRAGLDASGPRRLERRGFQRARQRSAGRGRTIGPAPIRDGLPAYPLRLRFDSTTPPLGCPRLEFTWAHRPELGTTEIVVPAGIFPPGARPRVEPGDAFCRWEPSRRLLTCDAARPVNIRVILEVP